ncbi:MULTISPECIES: NCS1 family nucleobase:cation symporter-1 [Bradyrhizobium]|jgi:nucleobase:cation symporter-1, NCS1 family|uniref:NCS1 family nucleobase:cation symporter-1 n=1 Tax=Bradyrhizobium TaxID=374 RepID=UPI0004B3CDED|nr:MULTISPECIES: NCS1 family nucleobase:cation symporter-1 [Bradyrhizobium]MCS3453455.1 NCS1 family nucleobase:cation symporter-1 [Bradyrhizobium elkanii]MCS3564437.1 NCS1 family nucleobase:cation symporter-1 [Bradyrhizobium elkanii]MCW2145731.1 NCS1 family nucleobase:cation symporter-1 [Bradyrhizobium elkanii]MCW2355200.1 NCS1 family nucleobase:cation symporter-1 [Bradyrhizobium elkanii]MCW2378558.1 NCS1 family nucleobase:cation symporter-1 [Bradyrhizobium elkanii]
MDFKNLEIKNASPSLYNEDLAPARERNWGAFSIFNVWTSDVHSLWGYYLAASLFLLCGSFVNFILAIGVGSLVIFVLMSLIGNAGVKTGVPYPVLARASFGVWGANIPALVRAVVACFWYGAQTAAASGAIVALLTRIDSFKAFHQSSHMLGHSTLEVICFVVIWALQLLIIQRGMETVRRFQDWAGPAVWLMMLILAIYLCIAAGGISLTAPIPQDVLLEKTKEAGVPGVPGSFPALCAVAATWITYFAALYLNFCDFSRYAPDVKALRKGNIWGLPVNLILFSLVAGVTTIAAFNVYHEVLLHPDQISAKFDSWFLALLAAVTFAVATLGINVVANFVSPAFDFSNVFPRHIDFKKGGYIAALIALALYPFAPWEGSAASFVGLIGATMGPIFGIMMVDYYLIAKGRVNVPALYQENGEYRFQNGWNVSALIAAGIGALFSSVLPNFTSILPTWWAVYGWFFGVGIAGAVYYALRVAMPSPVARTA